MPTGLEELVKELRALAEKATPGPWRGPMVGVLKPGHRFREGSEVVGVSVSDGSKIVSLCGFSDDGKNEHQNAHDAALIAFLGTHALTIATALETQAALVEALEDAVAAVRGMGDPSIWAAKLAEWDAALALARNGAEETSR